MNIKISTNFAPSAIGPYSQGISAGGMIFVSGQLPVNPETGEFAADPDTGVSDIKAQTAQSLKNIAAILAAAGANIADIVKTTVFLKNMDDFAGMNAVYSEFFDGENGADGEVMFPARSTVPVSSLPKDALVEIEATAIHPPSALRAATPL